MQSYGGGLMTGCAMDATHIDHVVQLVGYGYDSDFDKVRTTSFLDRTFSCFAYLYAFNMSPEAYDVSVS